MAYKYIITLGYVGMSPKTPHISVSWLIYRKCIPQSRLSLTLEYVSCPQRLLIYIQVKGRVYKGDVPQSQLSLTLGYVGMSPKISHISMCLFFSDSWLINFY